MKCVSYNIQYGIGLDGTYDLARIVDAVRGADLIALQEVSRGNPRNGGVDMVAAIREALPDYFAATGVNFEADVGSHVKDGRAVSLSFQLNNMVLSKTPIRLSRNLLLPGTRGYERMSLQRGAVEALVETPFGPLRFYSTHLDHISTDTRLKQVAFLKERLLSYLLEGGALSGLAELGLPEPALPEHFIVMGDFNMLAGSPEHVAIAGTPDHEFGRRLTATNAVDAADHLSATGDDLVTWVDPDRPADASRHKRIDYAFLSASLAPKLKGYRVDRAAVGSDHLPVWIELG